ncbi:Hypothetical protein LLA12_02175 [Lactococcus lactis subsp. lactis]|nr:Hypothetical protein LLA12_02175 [Lactococcus lactis subsp. lactis]
MHTKTEVKWGHRARKSDP